MRFHSTLESVEDGEITLLAIIECFVAIAVYICIGLYLKTFRSFAIAIALAPLTLLRTEESARWGLNKYEQLLEQIYSKYNLLGNLPRPLTFAGAVITWTLFFAAAFPIRVISTLYMACRLPLWTIRKMPTNWLRQAFCTDFFYPPEILPLELKYYRQYRTLPSLYSVLNWIRAGDYSSTGNKVRAVLFIPPGLLIGFLPSILYRFSFKATSLFYYPFAWVAGATVGSNESLKVRLERFSKGELEKTRRWLSVLVLTALAVKIALAFGWIDVSAALAQFPSKKFVESFLAPRVWQWWQLTLVLDALLTFGLFYYADGASRRLDTQDAWDTQAVTATVSSVSFLRAFLAIVTMSYFFWFSLVTAMPRIPHS